MTNSPLLNAAIARRKLDAKPPSVKMPFTEGWIPEGYKFGESITIGWPPKPIVDFETTWGYIVQKRSSSWINEGSITDRLIKFTNHQEKAVIYWSIWWRGGYE